MLRSTLAEYESMVWSTLAECESMLWSTLAECDYMLLTSLCECESMLWSMVRSLFTWLHRVLLVAYRTFSCGTWELVP